MMTVNQLYPEVHEINFTVLIDCTLLNWFS